MKIVKFAVEHATAAFVLLFVITIGGLISYFSLPRESAPEIPIPIVIVSTPYFGVSPSDIETLVTQKMEKEFKGIRDLKQMTSTSAESISLITLEFETEIEIEQALQKVRDAIDKVEPDLPADAEDSEITEINSSDWPVLIANVSGDLDLARLKEIGESMQDDLEEIQGVLRVDLAGGVEREIQVELDPLKLRRYEVSADEVIGAIRGENLNLPGGSIEIGSLKYLVRVPGEYKDPRLLGEIVVKAPEGQTIFVKDVARIRDGFEERETYSRLTTIDHAGPGPPAIITRPNISLSVIKRAGENIIDVADKSRAIIAEYQERTDSGLNIAIINDASVETRASVSDLENNIISGMILVIAVLFFFMGGARNAIMVGISIPLSMLLSFIVLDAIGYTLNFVVLFSLILALGMLVDNAIVIVENIYRHASEGKEIGQAALDGTTEVGWAVVASTFTTIGAFLPMAFWPGVIGKFMGYLPVTVIITLLSSLFVALVINPAVASVFLKVKGAEKTSEYEVPDNAIYRAYRSTLGWSLGHRWIVVGLSIGSLIGTIALFAVTSKGVEFFPMTTPELFTIKIETADGTRLEATDAIVRRVADPLDGTLDEDYGFEPERRAAIERRLGAGSRLIEAWIEDTGVGGDQGFAAGGRAPHYAKISVDLLPAEEQDGSPDDLMGALREVYERIPGANIVLAKQSNGPPAGKPVNIEIEGEDLNVMAELAQRIKSRIRPIPGLIDLEDDIELTRPEVVVRVDRERAALAKLSTSAIAMTVRTAINGTKASVFREGDEEYDITVRLPEEERDSVEALRQLTVPNRDGVHVPIVEVAQVRVEPGTGSIRHKDQDRVVTVSANAAPGVLPANLLAEVQERVADIKPPPGYAVRYTGENEDQEEAAAFLGRAMLIALFIIALLLVTQFNSVVQPFIILTSVLLSVIGVLWSLILTGEPFGVIMTGIAVISLAGVVVNNSIVLIDYANQLRARGMARREAVVTAGLVRFRPVLLTAATTILGFVPLIIGIAVDFVNQEIVVGGRSVEMWGPMARAVGAGLAVATVLTLVVVPVLYSLLDDLAGLGERLRAKFSRGAASALIVGLALLVAAPESMAQGPELGPGTNTAPVAPEAAERAAEEVERDVERARESSAAVPERPVGPDQTFRTPQSVGGEGFGEVEEASGELGLEGAAPLSLSEALEAVRTENFDVQIAMTQITKADATIRKAYSTLLPSLALGGSLTWNAREITFDAPGPPGPDGMPTLNQAIIQPHWNYNVTASASLRLNARAWPLINQAYMQRELSQIQVDQLRDELEYAVVTLYMNALLSQRFVEIAAAQATSDRRTLRATERRRAAGVAKPFELTRARLRATQSGNEIERARLSFEQLRQQLAQTLNREADFRLLAPADVELERDLTSLKEAATQQRPSFRLNRTSIDLADRAVDEIYYKYLPTFALTALVFRPRGTAFNPAVTQFSVTLDAEWVLYDGGLRGAEIDERGADLIAAKLRAEQNRRDTATQLELAWDEYLSQREQFDSTRAQLEIAQTALDEAERAYQLGAATQLDVITAEDQLRLARLAATQDELRLQLAVRKLRYLAGLD